MPGHTTRLLFFEASITAATFDYSKDSAAIHTLERAAAKEPPSALAHSAVTMGWRAL